MEDVKYYFKYEDYNLAMAYFEDGNTIYCDDLGPFGGKRGEVISFNIEDVELDEDDAKENEYTAEDLDRPVVFDIHVSQLSTNTIEWDSTIGDLWCWKNDLTAFKKDNPEYLTEEDKINEIVKMIRDNHIDPKKIIDKLNEKVDESYIIESKEILKNAGFLVETSRKQKGEEFFTAFEIALKNNFKNVALMKKLKSNSKARYSFDTKEYNCELELEFDYGVKGLFDENGNIEAGDIYAFLDFDGSSFADDFFGDDEIDKIIKWIKTSSKKEKEEEAIERRKKEELAKKKSVIKKPKVKKPKYTDLHKYKSDIYDALTARGLNSEFAMDYVAGLDYDFMKAHQNIKELADEAVREWG